MSSELILSDSPSSNKTRHINFMKKWLKEDDDMLLEKLEGEDKINYNELENELGRSTKAIRIRCKKLIYENFEEESWEQLIDIANIEKSNWERYLISVKVKAELKETMPEKEKEKTNTERIIELEKEVKELKNLISSIMNNNS